MSVKVNITTSFGTPGSDLADTRAKSRSVTGNSEERTPVIGGSLKKLVKRVQKEEMLQAGDERRQTPLSQLGAETKSPADPAEFKYKHEINMHSEEAATLSSESSKSEAISTPLNKSVVSTAASKTHGSLLPPPDPKLKAKSLDIHIDDKPKATSHKEPEEITPKAQETKPVNEIQVENEMAREQAIQDAPTFMQQQDRLVSQEQDESQMVKELRREQIFGQLGASDALKGHAISIADGAKEHKKDLVGQYVSQLHRDAKAQSGLLEDLAERINSLQHKIDEKTIMEKAAEARLSNSRTSRREVKSSITDELPTAIPLPKINYQSQESDASSIKVESSQPNVVVPKSVALKPQINPDGGYSTQVQQSDDGEEAPAPKINIEDYTKELQKALSGIDVSGTEINLKAEDGTQPINKLQTEGVFGISSSGRHLGVRDFVRDKQFAYQLDHKNLTIDSFFKETEEAIYKLLNSPESSGVSKPLIKVAEAINNYRNTKLKAAEAQ